MSGNSSASRGPPKEEDEEDDNVSQFGYGSGSENEDVSNITEAVSSSSEEDEPILTEKESIDKYNRTVAAHNPRSTKEMLKFNHILEAAGDSFRRTNVERRDWEIKNTAGAGGGGARPPRYDAEGSRIIESAAVFNANNAAARARAANQTIYYPPVPPPPPAAPAPVTVTTATPVTVTGPGPGNTAAAAPEATEVSLRRRRAKREEDDFKRVPQRDPRTGKSFCEKLGDCSIQGGSRKRSKKSKAAKKSRKARRTSRSRRVKKSRRSNSRKVKRHQ